MADADYTNEKWLPVVGYEGCYEVSSLGNVRSVDRLIEYADGLAAGTELQARAIEHPESGGSAAAGPLAEYVASNGATFVHYNVAADTVPDGHRVRFQVMHFGAETARITSGTAKAFAWPT